MAPLDTVVVTVPVGIRSGYIEAVPGASVIVLLRVVLPVTARVADRVVAPATVIELENVAIPATFNVLLRTVLPVTDTVLEKVATPVTPSVPLSVVLPATVTLFENVPIPVIVTMLASVTCPLALKMATLEVEFVIKVNVALATILAELASVLPANRITLLTALAVPKAIEPF